MKAKSSSVESDADKENSVQIRPVLPRDLDRVNVIEQHVFSHPHSYRQLERMLNAKTAGLVLLVGGAIKGYALCSSGGGEADLLVIAVDNHYQRQGFGERLLDQLLVMLQECGVDSLFLEVRSSNISAIGFYRSQSFLEVGVRRNYYPLRATEREDAVLFKRCLLD